MNATASHDVDRSKRDGLSRQLDSLAWGSFFIWIGIAIFGNVSWSWWFVGVGIIILSAEAIRKARKLPSSSFWVVCGAMFLIGGLWELLNIRLSLAPFLLIAFGLVVIWKAAAGDHPLSH
jgi:hypothetical protein